MSDKLLAPIQLEGAIHFVHPEGHTAKVTFTFGPGKPVTADALQRAIETASKAVAEQGFVLMGPDTFFNHVVVKEKTGQVGRFATPVAFQFEAFGVPTLELPWRDAHDEEDDFEDD